MKLTRILSLLLALTLTVLLCACGSASTEETENIIAGTGEATEIDKTVVRLGGLKGATSIGLVKLLADDEAGATALDYEFTMGTAADELTPLLLKGELDILAVPTNLGAILSKKTEGGVQMAAACTLGVLYIVEKGGDSISSIADLKGTTIYATGKGTTPEYVLTYLLAEAGLSIDTDVTVNWKSEPTEIVSVMSQEEHVIAMMPQPFVTVAQNTHSDLRIAVDMTAAWDSLDNGSRLVTAGLIVRREFAEEHPVALATFLQEYAESVNYVNTNLAEAATLVEQYGIVKAAIAEKAIPYCNVVCITGEDMKTAVSGYLTALYNCNPTAVGGELPADSFYLIP